MSAAVLNSRFWMRLFTSGEEDFERVSMLKDILSTACELAMFISSICVTFSVTCLTVASLITASCQRRWPIHSCSFYKVSRFGVQWILGYTWSQLISVYNTVKELFKSDSICQSYDQMKKGPAL